MPTLTLSWPINAERAYARQDRLALYRLAKRAFDLALATLLLLLLSPLMLLIALAIVLDSPGPALFVQKRVLGEQSLRDGPPEEHVFDFYKFRTMVHRADQSIHQEYMRRLIRGEVDKTGSLFKLEHDPRVTRVGRFLRKTSLDELPQLFNILRGEMSFVGPRPAIPYEVAHYKPYYLERLTVAQGLTGLWQIMGRNELSFEEMVALDIQYARNRSFWGDLKILISTIPAVLRCRGVC
ncbi:MAG: sugar transferase [Chloroflexi bacterium]|nr:sugar transferase [Chloroflexota bacterium]